MYQFAQHNGKDRKLESLGKAEAEAYALKLWLVDLAFDTMTFAAEIESNWTVDDCKQTLREAVKNSNKPFACEGTIADIDAQILNAIAMALRMFAEV